MAFLYTIARNLCYDYFRNAKQTVELDTELPVIDKQYHHTETAIDVKNAIAKLNQEEQELVLLKFSNELKIGEIAEYLGISRFVVYRKLQVIEKN